MTGRFTTRPDLVVQVDGTLGDGVDVGVDGRTSSRIGAAAVAGAGDSGDGNAGDGEPNTGRKEEGCDACGTVSGGGGAVIRSWALFRRISPVGEATTKERGPSVRTTLPQGHAQPLW